MGEVYLAEDTTLRRLVAIKLLPARFTADRDRLQRFEREAFAASSLNHPNILTIHEIGAENGHHFIATEFIDGESLRQHLKDRRLETHEVLDIGVQAHRRWPRRTPRESCIETSSLRTSWCARMAS